jgi:hypothetical protein
VPRAACQRRGADLRGQRALIATASSGLRCRAGSRLPWLTCTAPRIVARLWLGLGLELVLGLQLGCVHYCASESRTPRVSVRVTVRVCTVPWRVARLGLGLVLGLGLGLQLGCVHYCASESRTPTVRVRVRVMIGVRIRVAVRVCTAPRRVARLGLGLG